MKIRTIIRLRALAAVLDKTNSSIDIGELEDKIEGQVFALEALVQQHSELDAIYEEARLDILAEYHDACENRPRSANQ